MRYGVDRIDPFLEINDMLPGAAYNRLTPPGLTLGYIPMPCLSIVIRRSQIVFCTHNTHAGRAGAVLMHASPELPLFTTTIQMIDVTSSRRTLNGTRTTPAALNATLLILERGRISPASTYCALSDLSHYQPD